MRYYDPMFYICSSDMPFGIRIEATLKYKTEKSALQYAVNTAIKRYPYFSGKIVKKGNDLITVPNDLPIKVFEGDLPYPLASKEVNGHILALSFCGNKINFHTTHVLTDGATPEILWGQNTEYGSMVSSKNFETLDIFVPAMKNMFAAGKPIIDALLNGEF